MKKLRIISRIITVILLIFLTITATFAWLAKKDEIDPSLAHATVIKQYFHTGTGTEEDPYVITRPVHYYNLVQLYQRTTGFKPSTGDETKIYFQLGYELDPNSEGLEFYSYGDDGKPVTSGDLYTKELNMQFYSGENALLPIGTSEIPFNDVFEGNSLTVKNLHIKATETAGDTTYGTSDIGIFGYVTEDAEIRNAYFSSFVIDLSGVDASKTVSGHNIDVHTSEVNGDPDLVYVGYIAGHVKTSTTIEHVYINNCTIVGGDAAKSGFGYFGCVENMDGTEVSGLGELVANLHTSGDGAGFGGSIDMKNILNRLTNVFTAGEFKKTYGSVETITIDEREGTRESELSNYATLTFQASSTNGGGTTWNANQGVNKTNDGNYYFQYRYYSNSVYDGEYYFYDRTTNDGHRYELIGGESSLNKKSIITFTYKDSDPDLDAWYIKDNDIYLSNNGTALSTSNAEADAAKWIYESTSGGFYIYTYIKTTTTDNIVKYYLNRSGTYGVALGTTAQTVWQKTSNSTDESFNSHLYTTVSGTSYYLDYMNGWRLTPYLTTYSLSSGTNYLSNSGTNLVNRAIENQAIRWTVSNPSGDTTFLTIINDSIYYLSCDGTLYLGNNSFTWHKDGNGYYANVSGIRHDLVFDGTNWKVIAHSGKKITDGNGNYLTAIKEGNGAVVSSTTEAEAVLWQFSNSSGNTQIYTIVNGNVYYLTYNNGLKMASSGITWTRSGNSFYYDDGNSHNYYLTYDNGWTVAFLQYMHINDGNDNYLKVTGENSFERADASGATHFYSSSITNGNSTGSIYCIVGGTIYYLYNNNGTLGTSTSETTTWQNNGSGTLKVNNQNYWLEYSSATGWGLVSSNTYYYVRSGSNYLSLNGNSITNATTASNATKWIYNNNKLQGISNTSRYLRINSSSGGCGGTSYSLEYGTTNSNNNWELTGNKLHETSTSYYLRYNNGWTYSENNNNASNITMDKHEAKAYIGYADVTPTPSVMISDISNSPTNLSLTRLDINELTYKVTLQQELKKSYVTGKNGGYNTYFPIKLATSDEGSWYDANDPYKVSMKNTGYIIGGNRVIDSTTLAAFQKSSGDIRISYFPIDQIASSYTSSGFSTSTISYNGNYLILNAEKDGVANTTEVDEAIVWTFTGSGNNYNISTKINNVTYYLNTTGNNNNRTLTISTSDATTWTYTNNDFRSGNNGNSYLAYNNGWILQENSQTVSVTQGSFTTIYTVNDSGSTQIPKETDAFKEAKRQLLETLSGSSSVYGLHFMDAEISKDYIVTAPKAVVLGREYDNYQMPQDSINFNVMERGTINFFAGNYFDGNNTFFSLYKVIRDENANIDKILEIVEVYEITNSNQNYIYRFKDSAGNYTYSNADGTYNGATTLAPGYNTTPVFKTSWITNPGISKGTSLYYFEIPCNAGEYCLGSVKNKTGAYLVYLDIASNGGEAINSVISGEGNGVTEAFKFVEYRDRPYKLEEDQEHGISGRSILQLAVSAPDGTNENTFSVNVQFFNDAGHISQEHYSKGIYVITIVNKSNESVVLDVFLCDDDDNSFNNMDFGYAYQIVYSNADHTNSTIHTLITDLDYFKSMGSFTIPSSGPAVESTYVG